MKIAVNIAPSPFPRATAPSPSSDAATPTHVLDFSAAREDLHITGKASGSRPAKYVYLPAQASNSGDGTDAIYRLKNAGYSNFHAAMEVTMAKLFKLTGLACPSMHLVKGCDALMGDCPSEDPRWYVAARFDRDFIDLGPFLLSQSAEHAIAQNDPKWKNNYEEQKRIYLSALAAQKNIEAQHGAWWQFTDRQVIACYRQADERRFSALEALNRMLPRHLQIAQEKHYLASLFIGNWDHLNCFMENFGYTAGKNQGDRIGETVDFGSSGPLGFQGQAKHAGHRTAIAQRPEALFPLPPIFSEENRTFSAFPGAMPPSLTGIAELPYGYQSRTTVQGLINAETDSWDAHSLRDERSAAAREIAYRIHLIPDDVIASVIVSQWTDPPDDFSLTQRQMIDAILERKASIVEKFGQGRLSEWEAQCQAQAANARNEVSNALSELGFPAGTVTSLARHEWP